MSDVPRLNSREIDTLIVNGHQMIERLRLQIETGRIDPTVFLQRLTSFQDIITKLGEYRKHAVQQERLARLYTVSRLIGSSLDLQTVLDQVMDAVIQLSGAERGFLMLLEEGKLVIRVARNIDQKTIQSDAFTISSTITSRVLETGQAIVTTNAQEDPRFAGQASIVSDALSSIMASPLMINNEVIGVIYVDNRALTGLFSNEDLQLLDMFGEQAAIAIDNAIQVKLREEALRQQIESLKIEIDEAKKARQVKEIVETEYFQHLKEQTRILKQRINRADISEQSE
jgi:GAF domain-containing protein